MQGRGLEVEELTAGYDGRVAVRGVSFTAPPGQIVGLIGPNGSGKSTILKAISRVLTPWGGRVLWEGVDLGKLSRSQLSRLVATVPQTPHLPEAFTALEIVLMGRNPHLGLLRYEGERDLALCRQAMEATATAHLAGRRMGEVSGGERQRVVIARALAQEPRILLLDEPTAHLDLHHQMEVMDLVQRLGEGKVVVVAIHDLNLAALYCSRLVLLREGQVFTQGPPAQVIAPENIEAVYGARVLVRPHPLNGRPVVYPLRG